MEASSLGRGVVVDARRGAVEQARHPARRVLTYCRILQSIAIALGLLRSEVDSCLSIVAAGVAEKFADFWRH